MNIFLLSVTFQTLHLQEGFADVFSGRVVKSTSSQACLERTKRPIMWLTGGTTGRRGTWLTATEIGDVLVYRRPSPRLSLVLLTLLIANPALRGKCSVT